MDFSGFLEVVGAGVIGAFIVMSIWVAAMWWLLWREDKKDVDDEDEDW